jgi:hypothetical protein
MAIATRFAFEPVWGDTSKPRLLLFPAIGFAAWFGGTGPGVTASAVCTVGSAFFMDRPSTLPNLLALAVFFLVGTLISFLTGELHKARTKERAARQKAEQARHSREG